MNNNKWTQQVVCVYIHMYVCKEQVMELRGVRGMGGVEEGIGWKHCKYNTHL